MTYVYGCLTHLFAIDTFVTYIVTLAVQNLGLVNVGEYT